MNWSNVILMANLASCLYMTGLIWMVQVVHYPLFAKVGAGQFVEYQHRHQILTTWVVGPPMLVEMLAASIMLVIRPPLLCFTWALIGWILLLMIWCSTAFLQVPCHQQLTGGFDAQAHLRLVSSNWVRTLGWTARSAILIWSISCLLGSTSK